MIRRLTTVLCTGLLSATLAPASMAALSSYSQDFDGLNAASPTALEDDGWRVFVNVFDPADAYLGGYGFAAPNGGPSASAIVQGEPAGNQQLSVYSDYNNTGDHNAGNFVETNVFQEQNISAGDVGETYIFSFDAIPAFDDQGVLIEPDEAEAFIKTLDPNAGFAQTNFFTQDTSMLTVAESGSLSITIDAGLVGQILQFGFTNTTTNFGPSGVRYDNINFAVPEPASLALVGLGGLAMLGRRRAQ
ncbi:MAG: PEP-CTERM sorting domain-containing protein [Planctomycetota bacterium]